MWSIHQRLAELWFKHSFGEGWTEEEEKDFKHCLDANMNKGLKLSRLYNKSLLASMTNDTEWQHQICAKIDRIQDSMNP